MVPDAGARRAGRLRSRIAARAGLLCLALCLAAGPASEAAPGEPLPSDAELVARGTVIGEILVRNENIFDIADPKEDNRLFRLANRLHAKTRPWVIRGQLLFRSGDPYDPRLLEESERILRSNNYLYDARIRPVAFGDGRVDVEVRTRDVWTLNPGISFGRKGGANTTSVDFEELNLAGTGIGIGAARASTPDRDTFSVFLKTGRIADTWIRTDLVLSENSDGRTRRAQLERPFYSLNTRWAASVSYADDLRVDTLFGREGVAGTFQTRAEKQGVAAGWSPGLKGRWVRRYRAGFTRDASRFAPAPGDVPSDPVPPDRILAYPWIGFELVEDAFETARNRDQIARTEDFFLGTRLLAALGYSSSAFGGDREAAVVSSVFGTGFRPAESTTVLVEAAADGRYEGGSVRDAVLSTVDRLYVRLAERWLAFFLLSARRGVNLDLDHELALGGETGLRGYPRKYQAGDRSVLFTVEGRYYSKLYIFRLFHLGGAAFFDMGRAWGGGFARAPDPGVLRNVGAGLRIGNARSGLGQVIHVDVAFPLDGDPSISRIQFVVETKVGF
ncbi:MAG TPA: hypothetical protein VE080_00350 [Candidatus Aquicultoraceae bacterium]|nr:hypothetical protein [Candidatus Aquicultoraceae bacterium]